MANVSATAAAALAVLLFGVGLLAMTAQSIKLAGFSFLATSLVIYFRETRLVDS